MPEVKKMSHSFKQCLVKCQDLVVAQGQPSVLYINAKKKIHLCVCVCSKYKPD